MVNTLIALFLLSVMFMGFQHYYLNLISRNSRAREIIALSSELRNFVHMSFIEEEFKWNECQSYWYIPEQYSISCDLNQVVFFKNNKEVVSFSLE